MSALTLCFTLLSYGAVLVFVLGTGCKLIDYARTPQPRSVVLTPAPRSRLGVVWRLVQEVFFFKSLLRANRWTWLLGWFFHVAFVVVLLRHAHYFFAAPSAWMLQIQAYSNVATTVMLITLAGLCARRLLVDRVRYISTPADYLMLALLAAIGISGALLKHLAPHTMLGARQFVQGLLAFDWQPFPPSGLFALHIVLVACLLMVFPFSKLLHAPGILFNPTLNQRDRGRG